MHDEPEEHTHPPDFKQATAVPPADEMQVRITMRKSVQQILSAANSIMEGRYKSIALTHLETASMFFDKAIDNDGVK